MTVFTEYCEQLGSFIYGSEPELEKQVGIRPLKMVTKCYTNLLNTALEQE